MSETKQDAAPYALLFLTTLRVARFQTKEEWLDAVRTLKANDTPYIALKFHAVSESYAPQEEW